MIDRTESVSERLSTDPLSLLCANQSDVLRVDWSHGLVPLLALDNSDVAAQVTGSKDRPGREFEDSKKESYKKSQQDWNSRFSIRHEMPRDISDEQDH